MCRSSRCCFLLGQQSRRSSFKLNPNPTLNYSWGSSSHQFASQSWAASWSMKSSFHLFDQSLLSVFMESKGALLECSVHFNSRNCSRTSQQNSKRLLSLQSDCPRPVRKDYLWRCPLEQDSTRLKTCCFLSHRTRQFGQTLQGLRCGCQLSKLL